MKDIELQTDAFKRYIEECDELSITPDYANAFSAAWLARAAIEADRAQRVPDVEALTDKIAECLHGTYHCNRVWEAWHVGTMSQDDFEPVDESETPREIAEEIVSMLASTPAPAQQEPSEAEMVCAEAYQVVGCLLSDLGLFETEAARKILDNLSEARRVHQDVLPWESAQHQEQPQQERKPMTDVEIEGMYWEANGWLCADPEDYKKIVRDTERHHGIRKD